MGPKPWKLVELAESFAVMDADGNAVRYFHFADEKQRWFYQPVRMLKEEAREAAVRFIEGGDA